MLPTGLCTQLHHFTLTLGLTQGTGTPGLPQPCTPLFPFSSLERIAEVWILKKPWLPRRTQHIPMSRRVQLQLLTSLSGLRAHRPAVEFGWGKPCLHSLPMHPARTDGSLLPASFLSSYFLPQL